MFTKSEIDNTVCFATEEIVIAANATTPATLQNYADAKKAIIQVFTDSSGITAIGSGVLGYTPIAAISESKDPATKGLPDSNNGKGMLMFHLGIYEITNLVNIKQASIMSFASGYKVYCRINYYK